MPPERHSQVLRFGVFEVNFPARELRKHGTRIRLPGQPFRILSMLLEKPGEIVTREDMRQRLWASDTFVDFEHSLNSAIKKLRAALGDSPENPRYIETIPRVGYRFVAPVEEIAVTRPAATESSIESESMAIAARAGRPSHRHSPVLAGIAAALLITMMAGYFAWSRLRARPRTAVSGLTLAVLPFENLTGDPGQDYLSDGLTEEMIAQLGRLDPEHVRIIARTSVMHYKNKQTPLDQIGRELAVQYVLEGSVRRESDEVRITAQLIQLKDQTHVWSREYDRELSGLLALQNEVAQEIADEIQLTLSNDSKVTPVGVKRGASPSSSEAYDLYLKGLYFWNKRSKEGFQQAVEYFQKSIAKDPNYARAYAGLADTYALMGSWSYVAQSESVPKARAAALKALQLDDSLAEAHTSLALIAQNYDYDWQTAEKEYRRAIQLDPQYPTAHQWYAECLSFQGRFAEAMKESQLARQLDPLSLIIATDYGAILYFSRQYDQAIEQFRAVQAMEADFPRSHMVTFVYVEKGMFAEALADAEKWHHSDGSPVWEIQAYVYGRAGHKEQARRAIEKYEEWHKNRQSPMTYGPLIAYIAMGRTDKAIDMMEEAYSERSNAIIEIKVAPYCDPLRGEPRFQGLLRRMGLADSRTTGQSTSKP